MTYESQFIRANGVKLHTKLAGDPEGEPVLLLHGFPEFWYGWRGQIDYLQDKGFRLIAPDQRGYNLSEKPSRVADYHIDLLARDAIELMESLGYTEFNLVAHDWGAVVAWWIAYRYPERIKRLTIMNVPHPYVYMKSIEAFSLEQFFKSWYIIFFQIPCLPESIHALNNYDVMIQALKRSGKPTTFSDSDLVEYRKSYSQRGAMRSMLNWYRSIFRNTLRKNLDIKRYIVSMPTLILWGEQDIALSKNLASASLELCENGQLIMFPEASHWVQHDERDAVNRALHAFLTDQPVITP